MTWSDDDARLLEEIRDLQHLWCAIPRADAPPHVTAVWFAVHDARVWFSSPSVTRKVGLVRTTPGITLAFAGTEAGGGAVLEGSAQVRDLDADPGPDVVRAMADKYSGWDAADPAPWGPRVLVAVDPTHWLVRPGRT